MSEPFLGEIHMFGFNFAPRNWAQCSGQILPINQNQSLYSLLGTTYGGDGRTSFGLPDLRSRVPIHPGQGAGLSSRTLGQKSGAETHTLSAPEGPSHSHDVMATNVNASADSPQGGLPAQSEVPVYSAPGTGTMSPDAVGAYSPGSQAHGNMQPYTVVSFCIALAGLFPSRN